MAAGRPDRTVDQVSNVSEKIKSCSLTLEVYGSGFSTAIVVTTAGERNDATYFVSEFELTPKQARKLAKALREAAKLRERK